jgi:hypothetical protein
VNTVQENKPSFYFSISNASQSSFNSMIDAPFVESEVPETESIPGPPKDRIYCSDQNETIMHNETMSQKIKKLFCCS